MTLPSRMKKDLKVEVLRLVCGACGAAGRTLPPVDSMARPEADKTGAADSSISQSFGALNAFEHFLISVVQAGFASDSRVGRRARHKGKNQLQYDDQASHATSDSV